MNLHLLLAVSAAIATLSGCATTGSNPTEDPMCRQIAAFAESAADRAKHTVELTTDWSKFSKTCVHNEYPPGMAFCKWLMQNTSTEFMHVNINSALKCLGPGNPSDLAPSLIPDYASGSYTSFETEQLGPDYEVTVEFSTGIKDEPELLRISAGRSE
jgi:hypothetical protein